MQQKKKASSRKPVSFRPSKSDLELVAASEARAKAGIADLERRVLGYLQELKRQIKAEQAVALHSLVSFPTDSTDSRVTGSGNTRTFELAGAKKGAKAIAFICNEGASPVGIISASCGDSSVTVRFSADPSTDHGCTILLVSSPKHF